MAIVDRVGYPMNTRDLFFFRVSQLTHAPLDKDPETETLTIKRNHAGDGSAIFFQARRNGHGETVKVAITSFNKTTGEPDTDKIVLEDVHFKSDGQGGLKIVSQTPHGEFGVSIPLGAPTEIYRQVENSTQG